MRHSAKCRQPLLKGFGMLLLLLLACSGYPQSVEGNQAGLVNFLRGYTRASAFNASMFESAFVDLNDDGVKEAIVYLTGREWCGSGGCTTLILEPQKRSYRVVTRITITQLPIRVLDSETNGWHDLAVQVAAGGRVGYEAGLQFDGTGYPSNPSVPPAKRLNTKAQGKVVIPSRSQSKARS